MRAKATGCENVAEPRGEVSRAAAHGGDPEREPPEHKAQLFVVEARDRAVRSVSNSEFGWRPYG